jgi:hypothetical protein
MTGDDLTREAAHAVLAHEIIAILKPPYRVRSQRLNAEW